MTPAKAEPRLVLKRLIDAPRERVFKAWIDPVEFAKWWGPHGFTAPVVELDARPGGKIVVYMQGPKGSPWEKPYPMGGEFREVSPFDRIVFTASITGADGVLVHENLNEVTFADKGGKTELVLKVTVLKTTPGFAKSLAGMEQGWTQSLEKLDALFA
ncbi:MAG: SRPBCC domain-containing protein [Elusimicrobia bacterium]|nr:SRPBCC domain-containing protein [Elusimicrobiota bacterium]